MHVFEVVFVFVIAAHVRAVTAALERCLMSQAPTNPPGNDAIMSSVAVHDGAAQIGPETAALGPPLEVAANQRGADPHNSRSPPHHDAHEVLSSQICALLGHKLVVHML